MYKFVKNINKIKLFILCVVPSIGFLGCSGSDPYPDEWGITEKFNNPEKIDISGKYQNHGVCSDKDSQFVNLMRFMVENYDAACNTVTIKKKNNKTIVFTFWKDDSQLCKMVFREKDGTIEYTEEGIEISGATSTRAEGQGVARTWRSLVLTKAIDGSLVVREDQDGFGLLMVIPLFGTYTGWYKFQRID